MARYKRKTPKRYEVDGEEIRYNQTISPTPEEILRRCYEVRKEWTAEDVEERRYGCPKIPRTLAQIIPDKSNGTEPDLT